MKLAGIVRRDLISLGRDPTEKEVLTQLSLPLLWRQARLVAVWMMITKLHEVRGRISCDGAPIPSLPRLLLADALFPS